MDVPTDCPQVGGWGGRRRCPAPLLLLLLRLYPLPLPLPLPPLLQRERRGWLGDGQLSAEYVMHAYDVRRWGGGGKRGQGRAWWR